MPQIDFDEVEDVKGFKPLPAGTYTCRLEEVEESSTQWGDEMWKLKFVVTEGQYEGRWIFDNLVFSARAMKRVKFICSRLGLAVAGAMNLTPEMLQGRSCAVQVDIEDYTDGEGRAKQRNVVPFAGYEALEPGDRAAGLPT